MYCMLKQKYIQKLTSSWTAFCINVRKDVEDLYRKGEKMVRDEAWNDKISQKYSVESIDEWLNKSLANLHKWYNEYMRDISNKEAEVNLLLNQLYTLRLYQGVKFIFHFWDVKIEEQPYPDTTAFSVAGMFFNGDFAELKFETRYDPPVIEVDDYTEWTE